MPCVPYTNGDTGAGPVSKARSCGWEGAEGRYTSHSMNCGTYSLGTSYCKYEGCRVQTNKQN